MDIVLANERVFRLLPQVEFAQAQARVEEKKVSLVAGTFGALFTRPKPDEIRLNYAERRLEPFWHIAVRMRTVYDRNRTYQVVVGGPEVKRVTALGQDLAVDAGAKGGPAFALSAVEHCEEDTRTSRTFAGDGSANPELARLASMAREEIPDITAFRPDDTVVLAPEAHAAAVLRQVTGEVVRPVKAQVIHEERLDVEQMDLYFRPTYAFEYIWAAKDRHVVIEFDGLTGDTRTGGKTLKQHIQSVMTRDFLFDVSADAVGMVVPGGSIAVRLMKAVVDRQK